MALPFAVQKASQTGIKINQGMSSVDSEGNTTLPNGNVIPAEPFTFVNAEPTYTRKNRRQTVSASLHAAMAEQSMVNSNINVDRLLSTFQKFEPMAEGDDGYRIMRQLLSNQRATNQREAISATLDTYINNLDTEAATRFAKTIPGLTERLEKEQEKGQPSIIETALEQALGDTSGMSEIDIRKRKSNVANQINKSVVARILDQEGYLEVIENFAGFLISDVNIDAKRWLETNDITTDDVIKKTILAYKSMSPEEQIAVFPALAEAIFEASDENERKTVARLMQFLSPGGEEEAATEAQLDQAFLALDVGTIAAPVVRGFFSMVKAAKDQTKLMKLMGKVDEAGELNARSVIDEATAKVAGTTQDDAVTNATGGAKFDLVTNTDGLSEPTLKALRNLESQLNKMMDSNNPFFGEIIRSEELDILKEQLNKKWRSSNYPGFREVALTDVTRTGGTITAEFGTLKKGEPFLSRSGASKRLKTLQNDGIIKNGYVSGENGQFIIKTKDPMQFKMSDIGEFVGHAEAGTIETFFASPSFWMSKLDDLPGAERQISRSVASATAIELQAHVLRNVVGEMVNVALKPLGRVRVPFTKARASLKRVDQVLIQGDSVTNTAADGAISRGKRYTLEELENGIVVPTKKGDAVIQLTRPEIEAYYGLRKVFDWLYIMKNDGVRRSLSIRNFKNVVVDNQDLLAKDYVNAVSAGEALSAKKVPNVFDLTTGKVVRTDSIELEKLYAEGSKVVRPEDGIHHKGSTYSFAITKGDDVYDLPQRVLNYKEGYVPKIYDKGFYFVKNTMRGTLDGVSGKVVGSKTMRMFGSRTEAEAFLAKEVKQRKLAHQLVNETDDIIVNSIQKQLADEGLSANEIRDLAERAIQGKLGFSTKKGSEDLLVAADRELAVEKLNAESSGISGGLWTGRRATHDILYGLDGEVPSRLSAFESMQRNIQHISNYYPRNEWRMAMQQRWMNTARNLNAIPEGVGFKDASEAIVSTHGSNVRASLKSSANWINDQARIPTTEEQWFNQRMKTIAEWAERPLDLFGTRVFGQKLPEGARHSILNLANKDPYGAARAAAFHPLLGWFNPVQLFVQAQGFSIAASIHPGSFLEGMKGGFALTTLAYSKNPKLIRATGKALGYDPEDFAAIHKMFRESGLVDSIRATADHAAAAQSFGLTYQGVKNVADKGLLFYRRGELFTRSYSYQTAVDLWLKKNPGRAIKSITKDESRDILDEAMHLTLNMTRANRAAWQKGFLSLPTQFMQIQAKWIEAVLPQAMGGGHKLTQGQKWKMLLVQTGIYGTAGIPLGNFVTDNLGAWLDLDPTELDPQFKKYVNDGVFGWAAMAATGADNEIGSRGAIAEGVFEAMYSALFEEGEAADMLGAFGEIPKGVYRAMGALAPLVYNSEDIHYTSKELAYALSETAKISSAWRNATKAWFTHKTGQIIDTRGNILVDRSREGGFNLGTLAFQAMGFQASEGVETQLLRRYNANENEILTDVANSIMGVYHNYLGGMMQELDNGRTPENAQGLIKYYLGQLDPPQRAEVLRKVRRKLSDKKDVRSQQILKYLERHAGRAAASTHDSVAASHRQWVAGGNAGVRTMGILTPPSQEGKK